MTAASGRSTGPCLRLVVSGAGGSQDAAVVAKVEPEGRGLTAIACVRDLAEGWPVAEGETILGWREDGKAEGLGFRDHELVVGNQRDGRSVTAEAGRGAGDLDSREQA